MKVLSFAGSTFKLKRGKDIVFDCIAGLIVLF